MLRDLSSPMRFLRFINRLLVTYGISIRRMLFIPSSLFLTLKSLIVYLSKGGSLHSIWPIFNEDSGQSSSFSDYTIMDYIVADDILSRNPSHHFDIGSRIDGVILQLAHSIDVVVLDVRPNPSLTRFGVQTVLGNACSASSLRSANIQSFRSVSSLHAIEHFGLGRYGDQIDPLALNRFAESISSSLITGTIFYLGFPIGPNKIVFNAHRLMKPSFYYNLFKDEFNLLNAFIISPNDFELWKSFIPAFNIFDAEENYIYDNTCSALLVLEKK